MSIISKNTHFFSINISSAYTYSATLLQEMRDKKHRHEPLVAFAAFAPFYAGDSLIVSDKVKASSTRGGFGPLPYSKQEVDTLRQLMGGDLATGTYATKAQFLAVAGKYPGHPLGHPWRGRQPRRRLCLFGFFGHERQS